MNSQNLHNSEKSLREEGGIECYFQKGREFYDQWIHFSESPKRLQEDAKGREYKKSFLQIMAIESLIECIDCVGDSKEQLIKIEAFILLVRLYQDDNGKKETMEDYFYQAVELIRHYIGDDFQSTSQGREIISLYLSCIDGEFSRTFRKEYTILLYPLISVNILAKSKMRIEKKLEEIANILEAPRRLEELANILKVEKRLATLEELEEIANISEAEKRLETPTSILNELEILFGPMQIVITSLQSEEHLLTHHISLSEAKNRGKGSSYIHETSVDIFDKPRNYSVTVDRGGAGEKDQFKGSHLKHIIYPLIVIYIQKKEYLFFANISDQGACIKGYEASEEISIERRDYSVFIESVLEKYSQKMSQEKKDDFFRSLDICRLVTLQHAKSGTLFSHEELLQRLDSLLGGKREKRSIFSLVLTLLMSRHETMNGTGYPYRLNKNHIPHEIRIYVIIRAYEALCLMYHNNISQICITLERWRIGGYFDSEILDIFLETLQHTSYPTLPPSDENQPKISVDRHNFYDDSILLWAEILDKIDSLEKYDDQFRAIDRDASLQNSLAKAMNEARLELRRIANRRIIEIATRHAKAKSDEIDGPPGEDDESITQEGEVDSLKKGQLLRGLQLQIFTSPLIRARQTAQIIHSEVNQYPGNNIHSSISDIQLEETLRNPKKNKDNGRYNSYAQKTFEDNTNGLMEFLIRSVSSPKECMNLYITHRDSGRHLVFWLNNLFSQEKVVGEKTIIDNDTVLVYLFQGDRCIPWNLGFPIFGWKDVLSTINTISNNIFGESFYDRENEKINLIALHDSFLDFLDFHKEESPIKFQEFLKRLQENPITMHLSDIMNLQ